MNEDCLVLSTYFGERTRTPAGLLADELAAIYGECGVAASVLLRGGEGFGRHQQLRSDRLLSLSEDLPVVSIAIDSSERIDAVLARVLAVKRRGLVTLERARLLSGDLGGVALGDELREAAKLTVFVGRGERAGGGRVAAHVAVCELLARRGLAGASVLLGVDGTRGGERRRARFFGSNAQVPAIVVAVGSGELIEAALGELGALLREPLATLERVRVCKRDGRLLATPHELPGADRHGLALWQKLTVYSSAASLHDGRPLGLEVVRRLRAAGAAGATTLRGIWGFHGEHAPHGDRLFQLRRRVPVVTSAIDTPERSAAWFAIIDELTTEHGLVTSEMVPAAAAIEGAERHGGLVLARHHF